jgi:hypothetical protein
MFTRYVRQFNYEIKKVFYSFTRFLLRPAAAGTAALCQFCTCPFLAEFWPTTITQVLEFCNFGFPFVFV